MKIKLKKRIIVGILSAGILIASAFNKDKVADILGDVLDLINGSKTEVSVPQQQQEDE